MAAGWLSWRITTCSDRVTTETIRAYIEYLKDRCASVTLASYLGILGTMVQAMVAGADWGWLWRVQARLQMRATRSRNKRARIVSSGELLALGEALMAQAEVTGGDPSLHAALLYRDGLMIALLALRPLRRTNFINIAFDRNLVPVGEGYMLCFSADETKNRHYLEMPFPGELLAALQRYLSHYRPYLLCLKATRGRNHSGTAGPFDRLWITQYGLAFSDKSTLKSILTHTAARFGHYVNCHLFRDCAATTLANEDSAHVRIAATLLGHNSFRCTEGHYIVADTRQASAQYADLIQSLRSPARHDTWSRSGRAATRPNVPHHDGIAASPNPGMPRNRSYSRKD